MKDMVSYTRWILCVEKDAKFSAIKMPIIAILDKLLDWG